MFLVSKSARELTFLGNDPQSLMPQRPTHDVRTQIKREVNQDWGNRRKRKELGGDATTAAGIQVLPAASSASFSSLQLVSSIFWIG
jgi:hypothetical protein